MTDAPSEDCAWVSIPLPFGANELSHWLDDPETLYRINSLLEIERWQQEDDRRARLVGRNLSNGQTLDLGLSIDRQGDALQIGYADGLKRSTAFTPLPAGDGGLQLRITDDYSGWPEAERQARLDEVDRSLTQWGHDLHAYFRAWRRWSWLPPWRWYRTRIWLRMKPMARRITRWLIWITLAELAAFLAVFAILLLEKARA